MNKSKNKLKNIWLLISKLGIKIFTTLIKCLKGLKFAKFGLAGLSFAAYAVVYSWKFALLLMIAVGIHESGHVWAMRYSGIKTRGFYFLPFVGGAAIAESSYKTYRQNVFIAIMGPIWGTFLAIITGSLYYIDHNPFWAAAASWIAIMNLFNLFPVAPLDGSQLLRAISFSIEENIGKYLLFISLILSVLLTFLLNVSLISIVLILGMIELSGELYVRDKIKKFRNKELLVIQLPLLAIDKSQPDLIRTYPKRLSIKEIYYTIAAYFVLSTVLLSIIFSTETIDGADIASNFLR